MSYTKENITRRTQYIITNYTMLKANGGFHREFFGRLFLSANSGFPFDLCALGYINH